MDIYEIMSSIPHNSRYLVSYLKFINRCQRNQPAVGEQHHIAPKAVGLFPQFTNLNQNPWNGILLSKNQHIIAHLFLSKIYQHRGLKYAVHLMKGENRESNQASTKTLHGTNKFHECPWCKKSIKGGNYTKHHGDNCKLNPNYSSKNILCPHCGILCDPINFARSHGDNCRVVAGTKKINYNRTPEYKTKQRNARLGAVMTAETKLKLSFAKPHTICDVVTKREFSSSGWVTFLRHERNRIEGGGQK